MQHGGRLGLRQMREGKAVTHIACAGCALHAQDALLSGRDGHGMNQGIHLAYAGFHGNPPYHAGVFTRLSRPLFSAYLSVNPHSSTLCTYFLLSFHPHASLVKFYTLTVTVLTVYC